MNAAEIAKLVGTLVGAIGATLLLLVPGHIAGVVHTRGIIGPAPIEKVFVARTAAWALAVHLVMLAWTATLVEDVVRDGLTPHLTRVAVVVTATCFVVPFLLAIVVVLFRSLLDGVTQTGALDDTLGRAIGRWTTRFPDAWTTVASGRPPEYVEVTLADGGRIVGRLGRGSLMSSDPANRDVFVAELWTSDEDSTFAAPAVPAQGVWIRGDDIARLTFVLGAAEGDSAIAPEKPEPVAVAPPVLGEDRTSGRFRAFRWTRADAGPPPRGRTTRPAAATENSPSPALVPASGAPAAESGAHDRRSVGRRLD